MLAFMTEEEFADRLAAEQEKANPRWDFSARVVTCQDSLMRELLSVSEAHRVYGAEVVSKALGEMQEQLKTLRFDEESVVALARAVEPRKKRYRKSEYQYFDGGRQHGRAVAAAAVVLLALLSGTVLGSWLESTDAIVRLLPERPAAAVARLLPERSVEVNSDRSVVTTGSPTLKFSVPDTKQTEEKLQSEVESAQANTTKSAQKLQAEINKLRLDLENRIITLEAQRRALAKIQSQTSDASDSHVLDSRPLSIPTHYEIGNR
jgi:hypothetical protein